MAQDSSCRSLKYFIRSPPPFFFSSCCTMPHVVVCQARWHKYQFANKIKSHIRSRAASSRCIIWIIYFHFRVGRSAASKHSSDSSSSCCSWLLPCYVPCTSSPLVKLNYKGSRQAVQRNNNNHKREKMNKKDKTTAKSRIIIHYNIACFITSSRPITWGILMKSQVNKRTSEQASNHIY